MLARILAARRDATLTAQVRALCKEKAVVYDIKRVLPHEAVDAVL